jgi:hypothetical protein
LAAAEIAKEQWRTVSKAAFAALFTYAIFVSTCYFFPGGGGASSGGLIIQAPDDWYNGLRVSMAACLVSALGALVYRRSSRPMAIGLAVGLVSLNLDPASVWEQVRSLASTPGPIAPDIMKKLSHLADFNAEEWTQPSTLDDLRRANLYWVYYLGYVFWTMIVLYSGYIGQYVVGLVAVKGEARKESTIYIAERAGVGLFAGIAAGVAAAVIATGLSAVATENAPVAAARPTVRAAVSPAAPEARGGAQVRRGPSGAAGGAQKAGNSLLSARAQVVREPLSALERFRLYVLLTALCFAVTAYIGALVARPRTSTWVACGAIIGVMLLPAVASRMAAVPQNPKTMFKLLELSPFALAGTAAAAALAGDWIGKLLIARRSGERTPKLSSWGLPKA